MGKLTDDMTVKEAQAWFREQKKRYPYMSRAEKIEYNKEVKSVEDAWNARWEIRVYNYLKGIAIWIGVGLIVFGGVAYNMIE